MSKRTHTKRVGKPATTRDTTARVRRVTFNRISAVAHENRMNVIDVFDTLVEAWDRMTPEQKRQAIQREAAKVVA